MNLFFLNYAATRQTAGGLPMTNQALVTPFFSFPVCFCATIAIFVQRCVTDCL